LLAQGEQSAIRRIWVAREGLCPFQETPLEMRKLLLVAGFAAAALIPSMALAQQSCEQQHNNQVASTFAGAGAGALVGSAIAPRGDRAAGAVIGAASGAVIGSQVSRPYADCHHAYGYYDHANQWHANAVDRADARGYYDRDGAWVDGAPNGYYGGDGRWIAATGAANGYYDGRGRWIPASANGYYDDGGLWVASASGHYDDNGRWVPGMATGAYDANGRWMPGARSGHAGPDGVWIADAQPGYYDSDHHWRAGQTRGYYDSQGVWMMTPPSADNSGADASFQDPSDRHDLDGWEARLERRIQSAASSGVLNHDDSDRDLMLLSSIRHQEAGMRDSAGQLSEADEAQLQDRLHRLNAELRKSLGDAGS